MYYLMQYIRIYIKKTINIVYQRKCSPYYTICNTKKSEFVNISKFDEYYVMLINFVTRNCIPLTLVYLKNKE